MIGLPPGTKVFLACQPIDLRAGFDGLAAKVQQIIGADPFSGHVFIFRSKRAIISKACTGTAAVCACSPSVLNATNSCGRRSSTAR
jgi:transposase